MSFSDVLVKAVIDNLPLLVGLIFYWWLGSIEAFWVMAFMFVGRQAEMTSRIETLEKRVSYLNSRSQ